jgi:hypothetical protein
METRAKALASSAALGAQGPMLAYLSRQPLAGWILLSGAFLCAAFGLYAHLTRRPAAAGATERALMATVGGMAMLAGWFADAGFAPLLGGGICLCGCADSLSGLGLVSRFHWMQASMLLACAAVTTMEKGWRSGQFGLRGIVGRLMLSSIGMLAGMAAAGRAVGTFQFRSPASALATSYLAMCAGMYAGGLLASCLCEAKKKPEGGKECALPLYPL